MKHHILFKDLGLCQRLITTWLKTILKKGGHNYSSIINNWGELGWEKKYQNICYPKSIKTNKELKGMELCILNVFHGDQAFCGI